MSKQQTVTKIKQVKEIPGAMTCILEHDVTKTSARYEWNGPKIPPEVWNEVLAFFRWTYDETKSESQVRLYVQTSDTGGTWAAWAYPQKAKTGMTAVELDAPWGPEQRIFDPAQGWTLYGTVHHHCSTSAFQSSTDQYNEVGQDGIHITVGSLDKPQYTIHARLYQSRFEMPSVQFNLADFWDIGDAMESVPAHIKHLLPDNAENRVAALQMGRPAPEGQTFPEQWKLNMIVEKPAETHTYTPSQHYYSSHAVKRRVYLDRSKHDMDFDGKRAINDLVEWLTDPNPSVPCEEFHIEDFIALMDEFEETLSDQELTVLDIMMHNDVTPAFFKKCLEEKLKDIQEKISDAAEEKIENEEKRLQLELDKAMGKDKKQIGPNGMSDEAAMEAEGGISDWRGHQFDM